MAIAMAEHPLLLAQVPAPPQPPVIIDAAPGQVIDLRGATHPDATLAVEGNDLVLTAPEAPPVVVRDLVDAATADAPPIVQLADAAIPASELVGRVAPFDAVRVDTLLQSLPPADLPAPGRLAPLQVPTDLVDDGRSVFGVDAEPLNQTNATPTSILPPLDDGAPQMASGSSNEHHALLAQQRAEAGTDTIVGTAGDDLVALASGTSVVDLGLGTDTLDLSGVASLDLGALDINGVEKLDLRGGGANEVTLSASDLLDLSPTTDTLLVRGDAADSVAIGGGWAPAGTQTDPQGEVGTFNVYTQSVQGQTAALLVESGVSVE